MRGRRKIVLVLVALSLTLTCLAVAYTVLSRPATLINFLLTQLERNIGRSIEVGEVRLTMFPTLRLEITDILIRDIDPTRAFLKAKHMDVVFRLWPLLRKEVQSKRLSILEPEVELRRDRAGRWNFTAFPGVGEGEATRAVNPLLQLLVVPQVTVSNAAITLTDEFRGDGPRSLRMEKLDILILGQPRGTGVELVATGTIPGDHGLSALVLKGVLTRVQDPSGVPRLASPGQALTYEFEGHLQAGNLPLGLLAEFLGPHAVERQATAPVSLQAHLRLSPGVVGYDMVLTDMQASIERLMIRGQASMAGVLTPQPTFSLTFSTVPVRLAEVLDRIPAQWLGRDITRLVEERQLRGTVEVVTASITGAATPDVHLSMSGEFRIQDGHVLVGKDRQPLTGVSARVQAQPDRIKVTGLSGTYQQMKVSNATMMVTLSETQARMELDIPGRLTARALIPWLQGWFGKDDEGQVINQLRDVDGDLDVRFRLAGPFREEAALEFRGAEFHGHALKFRTHLLSEPLADVNGLVVVTPGLVQIKSCAGQLGMSRFEITGAIETTPAGAFKDVRVLVQGPDAQVFRLFPIAAVARKVVEGPVAVSLSLQGPLRGPAVKASLDLAEASVYIPGVLQKPAGPSATVRLDGVVSKRSGLVVSVLELGLPPVTIVAKGRLVVGEKPTVNMSLGSGPIKVSALPKSLSLGGLDAGTVELSLDIKGRGADWKGWQIGGWVAVTDGRIMRKGLDAPISDVFLRMKLKRNGADVTRLSFKVLESDVNATGSIRNLRTIPTVSLAVESSQLDLDLLIPKGVRSPLRDLLETLAASSRVTLACSIERGLYQNVTFSTMSGRVSIRDGAVTLDRVNAFVKEGRVSGRLVAQVPSGKPASLDTSMRFQGIPVQSVLDVFGDETRLAKGALFGTGYLRGTGKDPKGVLHSLRGKFSLRVDDGLIERGVIVPRVLGVLNVPKLLAGRIDLANQGIPFDMASMSLSLGNGRVETDDLLFDSPISKMTGAGAYDMQKDALDLVVVVSPLGSYSDLLKSIPLFGKLFAGDRKGIDTAIFEVTGPMKDPQVRYLPLESFKTGLTGLAMLAVDILKNAILMPTTLAPPATTAPPGGDKELAPTPTERGSDAPTASP